MRYSVVTCLLAYWPRFVLCSVELPGADLSLNLVFHVDKITRSRDANRPISREQVGAQCPVICNDVTMRAYTALPSGSPCA